ncbi:MAG: SixA phosphatase family protein [Caulobacteraceae bacterium]
MDRLILLRHGKAEADAPSGQDFDRALTGRGRRDAALVARTLADNGEAPDLVLVSPAARAKETWEAAASYFPKARVEWAPALYHIDPQGILDLAGARKARTVMVVGHNPGLGELAAHLARQVGSIDFPGFPTGAAAIIAFDTADPTSARAFDLYTPKALGGGA